MYPDLCVEERVGCGFLYFIAEVVVNLNSSGMRKFLQVFGQFMCYRRRSYLLHSFFTKIGKLTYRYNVTSARL